MNLLVSERNQSHENECACAYEIIQKHSKHYTVSGNNLVHNVFDIATSI